MKIAPNTPLVVSLAWDAATQPRVGRLAMAGRKVVFEYDAAFLRAGVEISPFALKCLPGVIGVGTPYEGDLPGVFNDSLPDGWGRLLVERRAAALRVSLTPLDRLAIVGDSGIGALAYAPAIALGIADGPIDLDTLARDSRAVLEGAAADVLEALIRIGGSPQGARPKAMIALARGGRRLKHGAHDPGPGWQQFLVKFAAQADPADIGPIELAYTRMAEAAGVRVPRATLLHGRKGPGYFAAARFDRAEGGRRFHVHTLAGLLNADHARDLIDYKTALAAAFRLTRDLREGLALFRLAAFNVLAHNRDDHAKQISFVMDRAGAWRAAPAYDLTFSRGPGGEHTMPIMGEGRAPDASHLIALGRASGLADGDVNEAIERVRDAASRWPAFAAEVGVSRRSRAEIGRIIAPATPRRKKPRRSPSRPRY